MGSQIIHNYEDDVQVGYLFNFVNILIAELVCRFVYSFECLTFISQKTERCGVPVGSTESTFTEDWQKLGLPSVLWKKKDKNF